MSLLPLYYNGNIAAVKIPTRCSLFCCIVLIRIYNDQVYMTDIEKWTQIVVFFLLLFFFLIWMKDGCRLFILCAARAASWGATIKASRRRQSSSVLYWMDFFFLPFLPRCSRFCSPGWWQADRPFLSDDAGWSSPPLGMSEVFPPSKKFSKAKMHLLLFIQFAAIIHVQFYLIIVLTIDSSFHQTFLYFSAVNKWNIIIYEVWFCRKK